MLKQPIKRILKKDGVARALCWLGSLYIRLVHLTSRWDVIGGDIPARYWREDKPFILVFWHNRLLMMPYCWDYSKPILMLASQHRDGQHIAHVVSHFGIGVTFGSSSKGGSQAIRAMIRALKAGEWVGLTPDGPRGPRMHASEGVVQIARMTGVDILPVAYSCSNRRLLNSWDRFAVAKPFGRGVFIWGEPIRIPDQTNPEAMEAARKTVEDELNRISGDADRHCGVEPVDPVPVPERGA